MTTPEDRTDRPALSVVLPLYRTRAAVPELIRRLLAGVAPIAAPLELIFVDDCCPERSYEAVASSPVDGAHVIVHRHEERRGQHAAIASGLRLARGDLVAVMDADLQDAPEDLARLVEAMRTPGHLPDAVAAARRGRYEAAWRQAGGRAYRWTVSRFTRGRIPPRIGLFMVMTRPTRDRVLGMGEAHIHPVVALARIGATVDAVPVVRHVRPYGSSSYTAVSRLRLAGRTLAALRRTSRDR